MLSSAAISLSGMSAAQTQLDVAAHNIANAETPGFRRQQVNLAAQPDGGVASSLTRAGSTGNDLESDVVNQLQARNAMLANLAVFKTGDRMLGALLDAHG